MPTGSGGCPIDQVGEGLPRHRFCKIEAFDGPAGSTALDERRSRRGARPVSRSVRPRSRAGSAAGCIRRSQSARDVGIDAPADPSRDESCAVSQPRGALRTPRPAMSGGTNYGSSLQRTPAIPAGQMTTMRTSRGSTPDLRSRRSSPSACASGEPIGPRARCAAARHARTGGRIVRPGTLRACEHRGVGASPSARPARPCGGIGRHSGFKIRRPRGLAGSSPATGTAAPIDRTWHGPERGGAPGRAGGSPRPKAGRWRHQTIEMSSKMSPFSMPK